MFVRLLLFLLLFSRSLPLSDWNTKLDSLSLVTGDTSYKSTFARVVRLEASCFLADGTPCTLDVLLILNQLEIPLPPASADNNEGYSQTARDLLREVRQELTEDWTHSEHDPQTDYGIHIPRVCSGLNSLARRAGNRTGAPASLHTWDDRRDPVLGQDAYNSLHPLVQYGVKELLYFLYEVLGHLLNRNKFEDLLHVYVCPFYLELQGDLQKN